MYKRLIGLVAGLVLLGSCGQRIEGTKILPESTLAGVIRDASTGKGIPDVAVSDGYQVVQTDRHGVYQMASSDRSRTVFYTTPAAYKMALGEDGAPAFYAYRDVTQPLDRHDFTLEPLEEPEDDLTFVILADPQCMFDSDVERFRTETLPDVGRVVGEGIAEGRFRHVYGLGLGDIVYDNLSIWEPMSKLFKAIPLQGGGTLPVYNIPGNHDHSNKVDSEYEATDNYIRHFGPTDYSFDRGNVHIICMDDVVFLHKQPEKKGKAYMNCAYDAGFTEEQLEWLRQDLSLVQDKQDKLVLFCSHIPFRRGAEKGGGNVNFSRGYETVLKQLTAFKDAELLIGHTHHPEIWHHEKFICQSGRPIKEHVFGAICGAWWHANICVDGTPNGYAICQVKDGEVVDYVARFTGVDEGIQMRVYDGNQIYSGSKGYSFAWESEFKNCFIASVWYDDPQEWKVELIDAEGNVYPMRRVTKRERDWCVYSFFLNVSGRDPDNKSYKITKLHYWVVEAPCGNPAHEKDWTVRATQTIPGGETHVYTCNQLQTDYEGL